MTEDAYYDDTPTREFEVVAHCRNCNEDTWHHVRYFALEPSPRECQECGEVTDYEGENE